MKKITAIPTLLLALAFASCGGADSPEADSSITPTSTDTAQAVSGTTTPDSAQVAQFANSVTPGSQNVGATPGKISTGALPKSSGSSASNPAHGQPGHRCDIAVGAPLNSPANAPAQPSVTPSITTAPASKITAPPTTPLSTDPNAKLNPAHGQPGHDCSIAVGAPLKKN